MVGMGGIWIGNEIPKIHNTNVNSSTWEKATSGKLEWYQGYIPHPGQKDPTENCS